MSRIGVIVSIILISSYLSDAYKILVMFPIPGKSHSILGGGVVNHLLEAGHEVTYVTPFPLKPHKNLRQVDVTPPEEPGHENVLNIASLLNKEITLDDSRFVVYLMEYISRQAYDNSNFKQLLEDQSTNFDFVIIEWMYTEISVGLSALFNCPFAWVATFEPHWLVTSLVDEALNPAYNADSMSSNLAPFTFWQRIQELWIQIRITAFKDYIFYEKSSYENIFGPLIAKRGRSLPLFDEIKYNASLILGNSHVSMGDATRLPQIYKPIGGYHINPDVKPLPEDLKIIMDNANDGVIYFSMGSNLESKDWPEEIKKDLLNLFGSLKQTVLWKFEEVLPDLPTNVQILQWAPQHSILSHPNCVLFITHGGLLSTTETIHFGVPIIGIPVYGDQFINVNRAVNKGIGKKVDFTYSLVEDLKLAISDVLKNPSYSTKVKELSLVYHDRVASPGAELVHWVEHAVRTRGAPHLRSPALMVPWYQKMYLDLVALVLSVLIGVKYVIKRICFSKLKSNKNKKNN